MIPWFHERIRSDDFNIITLRKRKWDLNISFLFKKEEIIRSKKIVNHKIYVKHKRKRSYDF